MSFTARIGPHDVLNQRQSLTREKPLQFLLRQTPIILAAVALYFGVRHLTEGDVQSATNNAELIIRIQETLGINIERDFQAWALGIPGVLETMNIIYIWGHWPVITLVLGWLAWKHREKFILYRNTLIISGIIGMIIVATFPMAPPRLLDIGFIDTISTHSQSYRVLQPPSLTNQYAAMPSFHFGWDLLMGIALVHHASALWARIIGYSLPVLMALSIVITGNHFILDALAGGTIVLAVLTATTWHQHRTIPRYSLDQSHA